MARLFCFKRLAKRGGNYIELHVEADATPQHVDLRDPQSVALPHTTTLPQEAHPGSGRREVLVQRGHVVCESLSGDVFLRPKVIRDQT